MVRLLNVLYLFVYLGLPSAETGKNLGKSSNQDEVKNAPFSGEVLA